MATVLEAVKAYGEKLQAGIDEVVRDLEALRADLADTTTVEEVDAVLQPIVDRLTTIGAETPPPVA